MPSTVLKTQESGESDGVQHVKAQPQAGPVGTGVQGLGGYSLREILHRSGHMAV